MRAKQNRKGASKKVTVSRVSKRLASLEGLLGDFLAGKVKFVPQCTPKTYTTNVNYFVFVASCDQVTEAESKEMGSGLHARGLASAKIICQLNGACPNAHLIGVTITRDVCQNRKWEIDATWTFECVP